MEEKQRKVVCLCFFFVLYNLFGSFQVRALHFKGK